MGTLLVAYLHQLLQRGRFFPSGWQKKCNTGDAHDGIFGADHKET